MHGITRLYNYGIETLAGGLRQCKATKSTSLKDIIKGMEQNKVQLDMLICRLKQMDSKGSD